jgi:hypothetical protein
MSDAFVDALAAGLSKGPSDRSHYREVVRSLSDDHLWNLLQERGALELVGGLVASDGSITSARVPLWRRVFAGSADEKENTDG